MVQIGYGDVLVTRALDEGSNPTTRALLVKAVAAYEDGALEQRDAAADASKFFSTRYLLKMGTGLTLPEVSVLLGAERMREQGLALARAGDPGGARGFMRRAKLVCDQAALSPEAALAAESFQTAAEAYVEYKTGDFDHAHASLVKSLETSRILNDVFGYGMEMRRIHLGRNISRVEAAAGQAERAMRQVSSLVRYIEGSVQYWPFVDLTPWNVSHPLIAEEEWCCMDEALGEIESLFSGSAADMRLLDVAKPYWLGLESHGKFATVRRWLDAIQAYVEGDLPRFLDGARAFFSDRPCCLARGRAALHARLRRVGGSVDPELFGRL